MNRASVAACETSLPTTRQNDLIRFAPIVSDVFVADDEMYGMPANVFAIACTSWLPAGPTTPRTFAFELTWTARVEACFASSCVSDSTNLNFVLLSWLNFASAYFANFSCSCPIDAAGPVNGPIIAIDALEHDTAAAACAAGASLRADAATTTASAHNAPATATTTTLLTIRASS